MEWTRLDQPAAAGCPAMWMRVLGYFLRFTRIVVTRESLSRVGGRGWRRATSARESMKQEVKVLELVGEEGVEGAEIP